MHIFEVIICRQGVPHSERNVETNVDDASQAAQAVERSRLAKGVHLPGDTYDAVRMDTELSRHFELAQEHAVIAAIGASPAFAQRVQAVAFS